MALGDSVEIDARPYNDDSSEEEDRTQLRRSLKERHVNMIAFSSVVGIGMFLQAGKIINYAGPGPAVIAYLVMGSVMWSAIACLGEMTALFPVKGAVFDFVGRFIDEGVGYAVGWMAWYFYVMIVATEVTAVCGLFQFKFDPKYLAEIGYPQKTLEWPFGNDVNPAVWAFLLLLIIILFNLLPVRAFGEVEYVVGCCKMVFICLLILFNVIINVHSFSSNVEPPLLKYYNNPYGFESQNFTVKGHVAQGGPGHLASVWTSMTTVIFGMAGFDAVAITAAECESLEKDETIKLATRKISLRVIPLYVLATLVVGFNVPRTDPNLQVYAVNSIPNGQHSVFIIAVVRAHLTGLPHFMNAFFIFSAVSAGVNALFLASRLLHALASSPNAWPDYLFFRVVKTKLERTYFGVPMTAAFASWLFGLLGFLAVNSSQAQILGRMATVSVTASLLVYCLICATFIRFYKCLEHAAKGEDDRVEVTQNLEAYDRENDSVYPYKSHGQYLRACYGLTGCGLILLFNGWRTFVPPFSHGDFLASYLNIPIFLFITLLYRMKFDGINPMKWKRRATEDLKGPLSVQQKNPRLRRGRLRRANKDKLVCKENASRFKNWIYEWMI